MSDQQRPAATRDDGVAFPLVDGSRSTSATGKAVLADALRSVDPEGAAAAERERDWHRGYLVHARRLLEAEVRSASAALAVAAAGLESLHRRFEFLRDGAPVALHDAVGTAARAALATAVVDGAAPAARPELRVPYRGRLLTGDDLHRQLDRWVNAGVAEPSFAEAVRAVMAHPDWLDFSDTVVVVLGAGAEMGPLHALSGWGATIAPVDVARPDLWSRVLEQVRQGCGRAVVPVRSPVAADAGDAAIAAAAGADLVTDLPEVAAWIDQLGGPLVLGNYAYADGAAHVRVAVAVDALTAHLAATRRDVALAVLATPTDVFAAPEDAVAMAQRRYAARRLAPLLRGASGGRAFAPNYERTVTTQEGVRFGVADCLVAQQGPNYALAKRLQRWRALVARRQGLVSSINVAPPTRTRSVTRNRVLAAAYGGAHRFGVEIFEPPTSNTLMAALLVHDLRNPKAPAHPATALQHPHELYCEAANHGGLWRIPYAPRSVLPLAAGLGFLPHRR